MLWSGIVAFLFTSCAVLGVPWLSGFGDSRATADLEKMTKGDIYEDRSYSTACIYCADH